MQVFGWDLPLCNEEEDASDAEPPEEKSGAAAEGDRGAEGGAGGGGGGSSKSEIVGKAVMMKDLPGGALPLVLPLKASWFASDEVHDIEKKALPEYFDGQHEREGKTRDRYVWHRQAILSQVPLAFVLEGGWAPAAVIPGANSAGVARCYCGISLSRAR